MQQKWASILAPLFLGLFLAAPVRAEWDDYELLRSLDFSDESAPKAREKDQKWEVSLSPGLSYPHDVTLTLPPPRGDFVFGNISVFNLNVPAVSGKIDQAVTIQASALRQATPWIAVGGEFGYTLGHDVTVFEEPIFNLNTLLWEKYTVEFSLGVIETSPLLQWGRWFMGERFGVKPYLLAGPSYYRLSEAGTLHLSVEEVTYYRAGHDYGGMVLGGGVGVRLWEEGMIGVDFRHQRVFTPGDDLRFNIPSLRFAYLF